MIELVELRRLEMPLVSPFATSSGAQDHRDVIVVTVHGEGGAGWGECVAMNAPAYSPEYTAAAEDVLVHHLVPRLWQWESGRAPDVLFAGVKGHPMAKAALEMAVLDLDLHRRGVSLSRELGGSRSVVEAGVAVGVQPSLAALLDEVERHVDAGYRRVKIKIGPGNDLGPLRAVRDRFPDLALQADANGAYGPGDMDRLVALDELGLLLVEQPFSEDDLLSHAALAARSTTPVCLDESITSVASAETALALGACQVVNLKPGRVGGLREAVRIHDLCVRRGVALWCGGMLETGIGRAANVALASLPGFTLPGDLSASARYFDVDLTSPWVLVDGCLEVPGGPGLGVVVDEDVVARYTVSSRTLSRP